MKRMTMATIALMAGPAMLTAQQTDTSRTRADSARSDSVQAGMPQQGAQGDTSRPVNQMNQSGDTTRSELRDSLLRANQMGQPDSAQQGQAGQQDSTQQGQMQQRSGRMNRGDMNLTREQIIQLQEALRSRGYYSPASDGEIGPNTRAAMERARQELGVNTNDNEALFKALNLDFQGSQGMAGQGADTSNMAMPADTSAGNQARQPRISDSTMMRPDSARGNVEEGITEPSQIPRDSIHSMQGAQPGRPVPLTNEDGDTATSALRDSLLRAANQPMRADSTQRDSLQMNNMQHDSTQMHNMQRDSTQMDTKQQRGNQTEAGVVNATTGASTLGRDVNKTRPDQGQPTTSKGDTVKQGGDSASTRRPPR